MRPKKEFKIARNGDSYQAWHNDQYLGSYSTKKLCLMIEYAYNKEHELIKTRKEMHDYFNEARLKARNKLSPVKPTPTE